MISTTALSLALMGQIILPGLHLTPEKAEEKSVIIVVARVTDGFLAGAGGYSMGAFSLATSEVLKGEMTDDEVKRKHISVAECDRVPRKEDEYIIFLKNYRVAKNQEISRSVVRMLPKSPENITAVKSAIQAGRKG